MEIDTIDNKDESTVQVQGCESKIKLRARGKKRKRSNSSSESEDVLPENALEVEHNLIASAVKNNLDDVSVKKILKKVVTNDHVLALVKLREEEEESSNKQSGVRPKLTRAKVKELMKVSPSTAPWDLEKIELTPIKHIPVKTRPEVKALIAQELPEDEDDDEYKPTHDDVPSDDDQGLESCSDVDSQPRTPATPKSVGKSSPRVVKDGPFKVPQDISTPSRRKLDMNEEEATIALRTRSKLCLSETPIEHIESSFVPPDEAPVPPVDDHLWNEFLNECLNPASVSRNEDDDETDPEYNVAADPDAHEEDEESLESSIVKISKKELNDLVTELFNIMPESTVDDELAIMANSVLPNHTHNGTTTCWEGKQEPLSDEERPLKISEKLSFERGNSINKLSIGKSEPVDEDPLALDGTEPTSERAPEERNEEGQRKIITIPNTTVRIAVNETEYSVKPPPSTPLVPPLLLQLQPGLPILQVTVETHPVILPEQIQILQQQLRQHIQLSTSNFLQLFVHPMHWSIAPDYKEYLESLVKMLDSNPSSVVGVCNLRPALELVQQWETTVAKDTPENAAMVEFIQREAQKWRRAMAQNRPYSGDFHVTFKKVVANSPVFLYPYLLPAMPHAPDCRRRFNYLHAEDELIALGLEEFWKYVEANPELFPKPGRSHPRHRWGLQLATELLVAHMFPWHNVRALMRHIMVQRKHKDDNNPISKFMHTGEVTAVHHKLVPFNPTLTLYEQPEHEMPQVWTKYLAQTSKRFKIFLRGKKREAITGQTPSGVDVQVGAEPLPKLPLPIDFTKEIRGAKRYPSPPKPVLADKFDVNIEKPTPLNFYQLVQTSEGNVLVPFTMQPDTTPAKITIVAKTSEENINANVPSPQERGQTNTVNSNIVPIISAIEVNTAPVQSERKTEANHCSCCEILREICKLKQTVITDFFSGKNKNVNRRKCECNERTYPTITKRLKLLIKRYKYNSKCLFDDIQRKLKIRKSQNQNLADKSEEYSMEDLAFVTAFQMKLTIRASVAKNALIKNRVNTLFSKFDLDWGDPIKLVLELEQAFSTEMVDMLKEFIGFLNPEQAERVNYFKDYFIHNCAEDLVKKIEEQVKDEKTKRKLLTQISVFFSGRQWTSCSMCTALLMLSRGHPALARYTFALFPHTRRYLDSNRLTKTAPTNTITPPEVVNEDGPVATNNVEFVNGDGPVATKNVEVVNRDGPVATNNVEDVNEDGPVASNNVKVVNEDRPVATNNVKVVNEDGPVATYNVEDVNEDGPVATNNVKVVNEDGPVATNNVKVVNEDGPVATYNVEDVNEDGPVATNNVKVVNEDGPVATNNVKVVNEDGPVATNNVEVVNGDGPVATNNVEVVNGDEPVATNNVEVVNGDEPVATNNVEVVNGDEPVAANNVEVVNGDGPVATNNVEDSVAQAEAEADADHETSSGVNYEADHSSSGSEKDTDRHSVTHPVPEPQLQNGHITTVIKTEVPANNDATEMMIDDDDDDKIEIQEYSESDMVSSEDETVKSEPLEWTREEDKLILEVLKQHITPEERKDRTIQEIIEEKQIAQILTESITDKSYREIKERVISILKLLIMGE